MKYENILNCKNNKEFRKWLENNHLSAEECWIECKRGQIKDQSIFYYIDAVYTSLCFGWIDSTLGKKDGTRLQRFSPRQKNSHWSEINKERCRWLIKNNLMTDEGFKILPDLDEEFKIDDDIMESLKEDDEIFNNFNRFPELYRKVKISNIQKERKNPKVFNRMLKNFLKNTKENKMTGNWNDYGRLG